MAHVMTPQLRTEIRLLSRRLSKKLGYDPVATPEVNQALSQEPAEYVTLIRQAASGNKIALSRLLELKPKTD